MNGKIVAPAMIENREAVECPDCGGKMYTREGEGIARHFYHVHEQDAESCPGAGESEIHQRCKALALDALKQRWGEKAEKYGVEFPIDVSYTPTQPWHRIADAALEFESRNPFFGRGIVIEVQYKNHAKDIKEATYDYISADFSVAWLSPEYFEEEYLDYSVVNERFESYPKEHEWQGGEPLEVGHAISVHYREPYGMGPLPDDLETYRSYPHPSTDVSEHHWSIMKYPWR